MVLFINYFSILLCSTYINFQLHKHSATTQKTFIGIIFSIVQAIILFHISNLMPFIDIITAILLSVIVFYILFKTSLESIISSTIISYSISYSIFSLSTAIVCLVTITGLSLDVFYQYRIQMHLVIALTQSALTIVLFRHKRSNNGLSLLTSVSNSASSTILSFILIYSFSSLANAQNTNSLFSALLISFFFGIIFFFIYWRKSITRTYHDKRRDRDLDILNEHLDDLETDYQKMTEDKDELARIVHRDNKLVPAMLLSVETFLTEFPDATPQMKKRGDELMAELREAAEGRKGIILQQDKKCTAKPIETGISALDEVLKYMQEKAMAKNITLSASADLGIEDLVSKTIDETDLKTLTNDLLENAIIANSYNNGTNVYFIIGYFDKRLAIHVYDSGIPFTKEVLVDLGVTQHTTHEEDGGSGIGSMEIFNIARKYRASYIIDEYDTYAGPYTKRISIIFDKRNKYTLNTSRPQEEINYLRQRTDLNIEARKNRL